MSISSLTETEYSHQSVRTCRVVVVAWWSLLAHCFLRFLHKKLIVNSCPFQLKSFGVMNGEALALLNLKVISRLRSILDFTSFLGFFLGANQLQEYKERPSPSLIIISSTLKHRSSLSVFHSCRFFLYLVDSAKFTIYQRYRCGASCYSISYSQNL